MELSEAIEVLEDLAGGIDGVVCGETCDGRLTVYPEQAKAIDVVSDALRWRPFPDEKPSKCGYYLVSRKDGWTDQLCYDSNTSMFYKWSEECTRTNFNNTITHWLPINGPEASNGIEAK